MRRFLAHLPRRIFLLVMLAGAALITLSSLAYFDLGEVPPFMIEKLPLRFPSLWHASLLVHVAAAIVALPVCTILMTRVLQRRPVVHRWMGRVAGVVVLFALVPTGAVLAFDAKGGRWVTAGFLVSAGLVAYFMVKGVAAARRRQYAGHARAMRHVFAQMSVAVTSRAMLFGFDLLGVDPALAYTAALWVPVLASAGVAELASFSSISQPLQRIRREISDLVRRVRVRSVARPLLRDGR